MPKFVIIRHVPIARAAALQRKLEREWMERWGRSQPMKPTTVWHPNADVQETAAVYLIKLELAGMRDTEIEVLVDEGRLVVRGARPEERHPDAERMHELGINYGQFQLDFSLPQSIQEDAIEAHYDDGFLTITLPKRPVQRREPRRIAIQVDESSLTPQ